MQGSSPSFANGADLMFPRALKRLALTALVAALVAPPAAYTQPAPSPTGEVGDIPQKFVKPTEANDYVKRVEMIPMRDGVKLYTVIVMSKGATNAPMILTRTPYNAKNRAGTTAEINMNGLLGIADEGFVKAGYIRVYQDIRGKYGSEGAYLMTRPVRGPLNTTGVDHVTDAWDTIDWLVKNVKES